MRSSPDISGLDPLPDSFAEAAVPPVEMTATNFGGAMRELINSPPIHRQIRFQGRGTMRGYTSDYRQSSIN